MTEGEKVKYDLMCCLVLGGSESEKHEAMRNALMYIRGLEEKCQRLLRTAEMLNDALKECQRRDD